MTTKEEPKVYKFRVIAGLHCTGKGEMRRVYGKGAANGEIIETTENLAEMHGAEKFQDVEQVVSHADVAEASIMLADAESKLLAAETLTANHNEVTTQLEAEKANNEALKKGHEEATTAQQAAINKLAELEKEKAKLEKDNAELKKKTAKK